MSGTTRKTFAICAAGVTRKESRDAHLRQALPERNDKEWMKHTAVTYTPDAPIVGTLPVNFTKWEPQQRVY